jgi:hypothetical protein
MFSYLYFRPLLTRKGKFISTHLDLIGAASSLLPSFLPPLKVWIQELPHSFPPSFPLSK